jgi:hypothetical protein
VLNDTNGDSANIIDGSIQLNSSDNESTSLLPNRLILSPESSDGGVLMAKNNSSALL